MLASTPGVTLAGAGSTMAAVPCGPDGQPAVDVLIVDADHLSNGVPGGPGGVPESPWSAPDDLAEPIPTLVVRGSSGPDTVTFAPVAGVFGHVSIDVTQDELSLAVRTVSKRCYYVSARSDMAVHSLLNRPAAAARLSQRERQAMGLIAQGFTHQQIARRMGIAKSTVETYVERIREKLQLGNKAQLAVAAIGILHSD